MKLNRFTRDVLTANLEDNISTELASDIAILDVSMKLTHGEDKELLRNLYWKKLKVFDDEYYRQTGKTIGFRDV